MDIIESTIKLTISPTIVQLESGENNVWEDTTADEWEDTVDDIWENA